MPKRSDRGTVLPPGRLAHPGRTTILVLGGLITVGLFSISVTAVTLPACTLCHSSAAFVSQTAASSHAAVGCTRCHVPPGMVSRLTFASRQLLGMALRVLSVKGRTTAAVRDATCLSCHRDVMEKDVTANGLTIRHSTCSKGRACSDCHSGVAHGSAVSWRRTSEMELCLDCHTTASVSSRCDSCHAPKSERERLVSGTWAITHGPDWRVTHGMGDLRTCAACHPRDYCVRCHGVALPHGQGYLGVHGVEGSALRSACAGCHQSVFCDGCHGVEMPHPSAFKREHGSLAGTKQTKAKCLRCHVASDCTGCHTRHVHPGGATKPPGGTE